MQTWFYYLVKEKGVATNDILDYYVEERGMSPQQYWFKLFGGETKSQKIFTIGLILGHLLYLLWKSLWLYFLDTF